MTTDWATCWVLPDPDPLKIMSRWFIKTNLNSHSLLYMDVLVHVPTSCSNTIFYEFFEKILYLSQVGSNKLVLLEFELNLKPP